MSKFLEKFTGWVDPKLEKYRAPKPLPSPEPYLPKTLEDFMWFLKKTPAEVLSPTDRATIASAISFRERKVRNVMIPKDQVVFVHEHDFLGPLMLDKLYKSGQAHFPVLSADGRTVSGVIHTEALNSLETAATDRAAKYVDKKVTFLRDDYTLEQAMAAFLRTNSFFFVVIDKTGAMVGLLTYKLLVEHLLGYLPDDGFNDDSSISAVIKRQF
ncbi:CBS domain-containing protein [Candidatus Saccharibacteria bacterium]|nr:CBS domain-containing protein [Candidatus Saccharibacteria bacterium]MBR1795757.1 CBS domain-containing protein [Candidatus Saccharibacteria bacterium]